MTFQKGESGNPSGRPKGRVDRRTLFRNMIEPYSDELIGKAVSMALEGNEQMLRLILDRMLPAKPRSEPVDDIELRGDNLLEDGREIIRKVTNGNLTVDTAQQLMHILEAQKKMVEHIETKSLVDNLSATLAKIKEKNR